MPVLENELYLKSFDAKNTVRIQQKTSTLLAFTDQETKVSAWVQTGKWWDFIKKVSTISIESPVQLSVVDYDHNSLLIAEACIKPSEKNSDKAFGLAINIRVVSILFPEAFGELRRIAGA